MTRQDRIVVLALWCVAWLALLAGGAMAQGTPNPVTPGFPICSTASGSTQCSFQPVDASHPLPVATTSTPPANFATAQVSVATTSTATVAARAGRQAVTITNITGTQPIYCSGGTATTANGQYIPAVPGANFTTSTAAAISCIAVTSAQTVSVAEVY